MAPSGPDVVTGAASLSESVAARLAMRRSAKSGSEGVEVAISECPE
jgi:hypothetical protein